MPILNTLPEGAKAFNVGNRYKAFALTGRGDSTMRKTQGVASLALGYVLLPLQGVHYAEPQPIF